MQTCAKVRAPCFLVADQAAHGAQRLLTAALPKLPAINSCLPQAGGTLTLRMHPNQPLATHLQVYRRHHAPPRLQFSAQAFSLLLLPLLVGQVGIECHG